MASKQEILHVTNEATKQGQDAPLSKNQQSQNLVRVNYHEDNEGLINRQINLELYGSYVYLALSYYYDRYDVALKGHSKYFKKMAEEKKMIMPENLWNIKTNVVEPLFYWKFKNQCNKVGNHH